MALGFVTSAIADRPNIILILCDDLGDADMSFNGAKDKWKLYNLNEDISKESDLSVHHPDKLKELVTKAEEWSSAHTPPSWFDSTKVRDQWKEFGMPKYEETFEID